jgi:hypothetical protein
LDRRLDQALVWDFWLRNYRMTPDEADAKLPYWMPEALMIVCAARADAERDAAARD